MDERLKKLDKPDHVATKLAAHGDAAARYKKSITYDAKPQAEIATVAAGSAGLARRDGEARARSDGAKPASGEPKKKGRFGLGKLTGGSQARRSRRRSPRGRPRASDTERNAKGGGNPSPRGPITLRRPTSRRSRRKAS